MKIALIIFAILFVLFKVISSTKAYHEAALLAEVRKEMKNKSILQGLAMNGIKRHAAMELLNGKISEEFYKKIFFTRNGGSYWEINEKNILTKC